MADMGWSKYIADQEAAHWGACFEAFAKDHPDSAVSEAEDCDQGDKGCTTCPWRGTAAHHPNYIAMHTGD